MHTFYFYIVAVICYAVLAGIVFYSIGIYKKAKALNPYNETIDQLKADIRTASSVKEELKAEIESLRDESGRYQGIIDDGKAAEEYLKKYGDDVDSAKSNIADLKNQTQEAAEALSEIEERINEENEKRNRILEEENDAISKMNDALNKYNILEKQRVDLEMRVDQLKGEINELSPQKSQLEAELEGIKKQIEYAREELKKIQEEKNKKEQEVSVAGDQLASIKTEIASSSEKLGGIKTKIDNITGGEETWGELDTPIITNEKFDRPLDIEDTTMDEVKELDAFAAGLASCDIEFNRRTINAFHTSLKVEESSPLVVLAGISGTGKSLLPQLYAKFFGFNFLNMAVQPRWDSSQDLFGFYNYAQFKYKATELSRLLWQYDVYNNPKCSFKDNKEKLPMSIILLDEMNLARVEYYFSDMLSKLETRRTITVDDRADRYLSEIEIECGSGIESRRLFVGSNALFVGTMNEDETTQALSDKIMDRANVLRFGRPKSLQAKGDPIKFGQMCEDKNPTTIEKWKKLQYKEKDHHDFSQLHDLDDRIDEINNIMEKLGRPFAHRVKKSIVDYVSNYPGIETNNKGEYKDALSDQIEFKILPKLNGIEKTNHNNSQYLKELGDIIGGIGDKQLFDAYDKVLNDDSSFFAWTGVRR